MLSRYNHHMTDSTQPNSPNTVTPVQSMATLIRQYWVLTKPRVTLLAVFCAMIGMFLAQKTLPDWQVVTLASVGIWLLAGASFAFNCLLERHSDAKMKRTAWRASATGHLSPIQIAVFACVIGMAGFILATM